MADPLKPRRWGVNAGTLDLTNGSFTPTDSGGEARKVIRGETVEQDKSDRSDGVAAATVQATLPSWANIGMVVALIFGGCCSNVFALEAIINDNPDFGALITLTQFIFTSLFTLPHLLSFSAGPRAFFLAPRAIPLKSWMIYTSFYLTVNVLNNIAFAFKISVPLHIIIRSGGPVASIIIGHFYSSKSYTRTQVLAVLLLTAGVVGAALADASAKGKSMDMGFSAREKDLPSFFTSLVAFTLLGVAMVLGAFQGVYADHLYESHGRNHWREALFYAHTLSLPFFIPSYSKLLTQLKSLFASPSVLSLLSTPPVISNTTSRVLGQQSSSTTTATPSCFSSVYSFLNSSISHLPAHSLFFQVLSKTPIKILYLILNGLTQYICIRGVHSLSAKSSSLTVTVVLNIRKLISLILSVYLFGNVLVGGVLVGAVLVFVGGGLYGYEGARLRRGAQARVKRE
ncbi:uncharacterized protein PADG_00017 [Paracoccidioides brasiliensis Pb18]|uniref:UAA transporter n=1 Tax=Paracoccidioides brasiliensis (strain Pb18) TaxID=502780 RepID=C1FZH7_PARBD|nr:uncharacterized protein PADG_00017 [Paracoccidioides brasiliensis Pb18]EEH43728.1 hypothetical protein PADG_00017 [Paracoccidioides brasiliensis Pb18]